MRGFDYQIIANCLAGKGMAEKKLIEIKNFLRKNKFTFTSLEIRKFTPIAQIPPESDLCIKKGIICLGGDGTISETIEFMIKRNWDLPIFIIPTGTANFIASSIGVRKKINYYRLLEGEIKTFDLGFCQNFKKGDYFLIGIGFGFEQKFLEMAKQSQKKFLGNLSYFLAAFFELFKVRSLSYYLVLDDKELHIKTSMLTILNLKPKIANFFPLFLEKEIRPDDGWLDIFFIEHKNYFYSFFGILFFHILGKINFSMVKRYKAKKIEIKPIERTKFQIDGELKDSLSLKISVIPKKIRFLV